VKGLIWEADKVTRDWWKRERLEKERGRGSARKSKGLSYVLGSEGGAARFFGRVSRKTERKNANDNKV